jgi:hypothetical protein
VEVMEPNGLLVMNGAALRRLWGKEAGPPQIKALNTLATFLGGPGVDFNMQDLTKDVGTNLYLTIKQRTVHKAHQAATSATAPMQAPPPTHMVTHPNQALISRYLSTTTQPRGGSECPHQTQTDTRTAERTGPDPPTRPTRTDKTTRPRGSDPTLHKDKQRKTAARAMVPEPCRQKAEIKGPLRHNHKEQELSKKIRELKGKEANQAEGIAAFLAEAYGQADRVEEILGWRMVMVGDAGKKRRRGAHPVHANSNRREIQIQYLIQWNQTRVDAWALPAFAKIGYTPDTSHPPRMCSRNELEHDECTCEICWNANSIANPDTSNHDDMPICNICQKTYHTACSRVRRIYTAHRRRRRTVGMPSL